jgi:hypothetical protein
VKIFKPALLTLASLAAASSWAQVKQKTDSVLEAPKSTCQSKDSSMEGATILRFATLFSDIGVAKALIDEKCVDINGFIPKSLNGAPAAYMSSTTDMVRFYLGRGVDFTKSYGPLNRSFLMVSIVNSADFEKSKNSEGESKIREHIQKIGDKYKLKETTPWKQIPDPTQMQLLYVDSVNKSVLLDSDRQKNNVLHYAIAFGKGGLAKRLGEKQPELFEQKNAMGITPLMLPVAACDFSAGEKKAMNDFYAAADEKVWTQKVLLPYSPNGEKLSALQVRELLDEPTPKLPKVSPKAMAAEQERLASLRKLSAPILTAFTKQVKENFRCKLSAVR